MHAILPGLVCGALAGVIYALLASRTRNGTVEEVFTVAALAFPIWASINCILLPALSRYGPAWSAEEMRGLLPALAGWILYGVLLVLLTRVGESAARVLLGPEPTATTQVALQPQQIVILGGGFAGMTTAESLEREFGADRSVSFTLVSENNALLFTPMLAEVAGSSLEPSHISSPLRTSLHRTNVLRARVTGVDFEASARSNRKGRWRSSGDSLRSLGVRARFPIELFWQRERAPKFFRF
jgi:NADH dehydrogenase